MGHKSLVGKVEGNQHLEELDIDGRIMLKCILREEDGGGMGWINLA
jgi:hypothetical protein